MPLFKEMTYIITFGRDGVDGWVDFNWLTVIT